MGIIPLGQIYRFITEMEGLAHIYTCNRMAISLKEQLRILQEGVHYHAPHITLKKSGAGDMTTLRKATQMFYDFYAMEMMHAQLGSQNPDSDVHPGDEEEFYSEYPPEDYVEDPDGEYPYGRKDKTARKLTPQQAERYKSVVQWGADPLAAGAANWADVDLRHTVIPHQLRSVIDQVYSEVAIQLSNKLMAHLRGSIIQEFRYMTDHASDWKGFRHKLVSIYNSKGTVSKEDFDNAIKTKIPELANHPDVVMRLLKFCRYYQEMYPDPADIVKKSGVDYPAAELPEPRKRGGEIDPKKIDQREKPPEPDPTQPMPSPEDEEPDDTDYNMPEPEIPQGADWNDDDWRNYSTDVEKEKTLHWLKTHRKLSEGLILEMNPPIINKVQKAIVKSGLTWNDIALAYNNLSWGGLIGGTRWGEGAKSLIKLAGHAKLHSIGEMAGVIDHIYDLQHNTGALLNKGGMYIEPNDMDRRANITHLARYLPHVSPLIKRLILRVLNYVSKHPEIEKDITKVTDSPTQPFPPEAGSKMPSFKFAKSPDGLSWTSQAPYENKKGTVVQNEYEAKYHTNGMYSVADTMKADIQVFETWEEFEQWLDRMKSLLIKPIPGEFYYAPVKAKSQKEVYLESHTKIRLDAEKEEQLKACKMSWKPFYQNYLASFVGGDAFELYAFSDGSFIGCMRSTKNIGGVFTTWPDTLTYCKAQTMDAVPLVTPQASAPVKPNVPTTEYILNQNEITALEILSNKFHNTVLLPNVTTKNPTGMTWVRVSTNDGYLYDVLAIGKKALIPSGQTYVLRHVLKDGTSEDWTFYNWNSAYGFISANFAALTQADGMVKGTTSISTGPSIFQQTGNVPLPAPSPSKASYKVHLGISKPPTHTIRLTQEDEDLLKSAGFEPQMQGSDVWYINTKIGDVVKFYPNDSAKIMFVKTNKGVVITKKIEDALTWLVSKYTGASNAPIVQPTAPSTAGSKAGAMYEKILNDAGFVWHEASRDYFDDATGDSIKIHPFPQSTFNDKQTGPYKKFNSLPELAMFVKKLGPPKP